MSGTNNQHIAYTKPTPDDTKDDDDDNDVVSKAYQQKSSPPITHVTLDHKPKDLPSQDFDTPLRKDLYPSIDPSLSTGVKEHSVDDAETLYHDKSLRKTPSSSSSKATSSTQSLDTTTTVNTGQSDQPSGSGTSLDSTANHPNDSTFGQSIGATIGSIGGGLLDGSINRNQGMNKLVDSLKRGLFQLQQKRQQPQQQQPSHQANNNSGDLVSNINAVTQSIGQLQQAVGQVRQSVSSSNLASTIQSFGSLVAPSIAHDDNIGNQNNMNTTHQTSSTAQTSTSSPQLNWANLASGALSLLGSRGGPNPTSANNTPLSTTPSRNVSSATNAPSLSLTDTLTTLQNLGALAANVNAVRNTFGIGQSQQQQPQSDSSSASTASINADTSSNNPISQGDSINKLD